MTSWGGTSIVTVLSSTFTILSMNGKRMKSPGPLGPPWTRPRRKMTPRSYSLTIFTALVNKNKTTTTTATTTMAANPIPIDCNKPMVACIRNSPFTLVLGVEDGAMPGPLNGHQNHPDDRRYRHHGHSVVRAAGRYAGNRSNVA